MLGSVLEQKAVWPLIAWWWQWWCVLDIAEVEHPTSHPSIIAAALWTPHMLHIIVNITQEKGYIKQSSVYSISCPPQSSSMYGPGKSRVQLLLGWPGLGWAGGG